MEVIAKLKNAPFSAQKARLVADLIRQLEVTEAINILKHSPKKGAAVILKLLYSVIANAENNNAADIDQLKISMICVDEATSLKRVSPRAKGRANRIHKRRSHITIKVFEEDE